LKLPPDKHNPAFASVFLSLSLPRHLSRAILKTTLAFTSTVCRPVGNNWNNRKWQRISTITRSFSMYSLKSEKSLAAVVQSFSPSNSHRKHPRSKCDSSGPSLLALPLAFVHKAAKAEKDCAQQAHL
jgi:hypothetical protein